MTPRQHLILVLVLAVASGCSGKGSGPGNGEASDETTAQGTGARITAAAAQKAGIEVVAAGPAQIRETLTFYGSIKPNAEREQDIRARYAGVLRSVSKRAGDSVRKGEELLTVESNESLQVYPIAAPLSGQVLERSANPGDAVDTSTVLMKVVDLSTVWAEFAVFARDLAHVRRGMTVLFRGVDADESGEATIGYIAPAGHSDSQSVVARAVIENRAWEWVPGQFISVDVVTTDAAVPVAVVPTALQDLKGNAVLFVQTEHGFEPRRIKTGRRSRTAVEIVEGLAAGERYAATNSYLIKAEVLKNEAEEE